MTDSGLFTFSPNESKFDPNVKGLMQPQENSYLCVHVIQHEEIKIREELLVFVLLGPTAGAFL